ncbi:MAG: hypothetical protein AMJ84_00775 [Acidithiobacillales bacterium SM23_46]|jgi:peptidoglycan/xylan/chitin deacetylase (PgdA/CDA1 family)|nr:MAG: hypothetical protein AMS22_00335 [Thiotrichales bacterium SG8_50]KPK74092.1 MAG: hypothetical protein AMJ84_00775 [Acidithiobacillales bacterium SM23_46]KPL25756.1 MAG: hypothetical protein AMJ72_13340 [Acidithiobacillales bacterium SM1_46]
MSRVMVLMYHGLYSGAAELAAIDSADRPYAVSVEDFHSQLDWLTEAGIPVVDPLRLASAHPDAPVSVVLTFDDGHESNYRHAYPILAARRMPAVFFVTSDFIGARAGFCSWAQLREMREGGMYVGAHGKTHRFFDDLTQAETAEEFGGPRAAIEAGTGVAPRMMSFPGGRYRTEQLAIGRAYGYELYFSSDVGANRSGAFRHGGLFRRVAVRRTTDASQFRGIARAAPLPLVKARAAAGVKALVKSMLGNRLYHALYERMAG